MIQLIKETEFTIKDIVRLFSTNSFVARVDKDLILWMIQIIKETEFTIKDIVRLFSRNSFVARVDQDLILWMIQLIKETEFTIKDIVRLFSTDSFVARVDKEYIRSMETLRTKCGFTTPQIVSLYSSKSKFSQIVSENLLTNIILISNCMHSYHLYQLIQSNPFIICLDNARVAIILKLKKEKTYSEENVYNFLIGLNGFELKSYQKSYESIGNKVQSYSPKTNVLLQKKLQCLNVAGMRSFIKSKRPKMDCTGNENKLMTMIQQQAQGDESWLKDIDSFKKK
jgi:hypothetical protein